MDPYLVSQLLALTLPGVNSTSSNPRGIAAPASPSPPWSASWCNPYCYHGNSHGPIMVIKTPSQWPWGERVLPFFPFPACRHLFFKWAVASLVQWCAKTTTLAADSKALVLDMVYECLCFKSYTEYKRLCTWRLDALGLTGWNHTSEERELELKNMNNFEPQILGSGQDAAQIISRGYPGLRLRINHRLRAFCAVILSVALCG